MKRSNLTITPIVIALSIFSLLGLATVFAPASQARQKRNTASPLRPQHEELVKQWLASRPELRLATDADYAYKADLAAERIGNESYHPYYAVADFNGDGQEDFAVALVNTRKRTANFAIAVFNGSKVKASGPSAPTFLGEGYDLRLQAFTLAEDDENARRTILFAENPENGKCLRLRVGRKGYFIERCQIDLE